MTAPSIVWLRNDLRLADNPALFAAARHGGPVIPVFILDDTAVPRLGSASRWWLHHSLTMHDAALEALGSQLILRRGDPLSALRALIAESGAGRVVWNRRYEPNGRETDEAVAAALRCDGIETASFAGNLLVEPSAVLTAAGRPYRVFTPFHRALRSIGAPPPPVPLPARLRRPRVWPISEGLGNWGLLPTKPDWAGGLRATWRPGEANARQRLASFLDHALTRYDHARDSPGIQATSRLSPHLHFGEISARQIWHAVQARPAARGPSVEQGGMSFLRELAWREFCHHLLFHDSTLLDRPLQPAFARFPWRLDPTALRAWQRGLTGYPIVDAGMRELWQTGWMHNRVRMIVASFLTKHLLIPWQDGAAWFLDTLVDADPANNAAGWQWVAGCGTGAQPFFRIFNPVLQGERFDPEGYYVRRFVPELERLPNAMLHKPWAAKTATRAAAGVQLGENYPRPIVEHKTARARALDAFRSLKEPSTGN